MRIFQICSLNIKSCSFNYRNGNSDVVGVPIDAELVPILAEFAVLQVAVPAEYLGMEARVFVERQWPIQWEAELLLLPLLVVPARLFLNRACSPEARELGPLRLRLGLLRLGFCCPPSAVGHVYDVDP